MVGREEIGGTRNWQRELLITKQNTPFGPRVCKPATRYPKKGREKECKWQHGKARKSLRKIWDLERRL